MSELEKTLEILIKEAKDPDNVEITNLSVEEESDYLHKNKGKTLCLWCKFFRPFDETPSWIGQLRISPDHEGVCHRYPPRHPKYEGTTGEQYFFPTVRWNDWCGEFQEMRS